MMKYFVSFLCSLILAFGILPTADAATVSRLTWADRNETAPHFVRIVLDLSESVTGEAYLSKDGLTVNVVLLETDIGAGVPEAYTVSAGAVNTISLWKSGGNLILSAKLKHTIDPSGVKIFPLAPDAKAGRPQRLVLDIPSKG